MSEVTRPVFVKGRRRSLAKAFAAAYGEAFNGELARFIELLENHDAEPSDAVTLAAPVVPTFATLDRVLPPSSLDAFFRGLHPVWFEAGDPAYLTAIAIGAKTSTKPVYEIDNDTTETVRVADSLDAWLANEKVAPGVKLPAHADPVTLGTRAEWLIAMLSGRLFESEELDAVPTLATFAKEKAHIATYPHLAGYWPLHHALLGNTKAFADAAKRAAESNHPFVTELLAVARNVAGGKALGDGFSALATFATNYLEAVPTAAREARTTAKAAEPFGGYKALHRYNVENLGMMMHGLGIAQLDFIDGWAAQLPGDAATAVRDTLTKALPFHIDAGEPLALVGIISAWARFAPTYGAFIEPLAESLKRRTGPTRWHEVLRCAARYDSADAHTLILNAARRWFDAFDKKPSDAYFEPQEEAWLSLFFTESPLRRDLAHLLIAGPRSTQHLAQLLAREKPEIVDTKLRNALAKLSPLTAAQCKSAREVLRIAAPTAAQRP